MEIRVLTCDSELKSAQKLGWPTSTYLRGIPEDYNKDIIIRWGHGGNYFNHERKISEFRNVINPAKAIQLNINKYAALKEMSKVVKTPIIFEKELPKDIIAVIRPHMHMAGGKDFLIRKGPFVIPNGYYGTGYIPTQKEIRVFFCGNRTFSALRIPNKNYVKSEFTCRSMFGYKWIKTDRKLHNEVLMAAKAIGLQAGAADILIKRKNNYFLELNSAVTIDSKIIKRFYIKNLKEFIKKKKKRKKRKIPHLGFLKKS